jgi:hypothetical protein
MSTGLTTSIRHHQLNHLAHSVAVNDRAGSDREVLADTQCALIDLRGQPPLKRTSIQVTAQAQHQLAPPLSKARLSVTSLPAVDARAALTR